MVVKKHILLTLEELNRKYNTSSSGLEKVLYSKLAILELCGWVEQSMDDVIYYAANKNIKVSENIDYVEAKIVKPNWGFIYDSNFRRMLISLFGLIAIEKMERKLNSSIHANMVSSLNSLNSIRRRLAHTHVKGMTATIHSPSITITYLRPVYDGLKDIEKIARLLKFNRII